MGDAYVGGGQRRIWRSCGLCCVDNRVSGAVAIDASTTRGAHHNMLHFFMHVTMWDGLVLDMMDGFICIYFRA